MLSYLLPCLAHEGIHASTHCDRSTPLMTHDTLRSFDAVIRIAPAHKLMPLFLVGLKAVWKSKMIKDTIFVALTWQCMHGCHSYMIAHDMTVPAWCHPNSVVTVRASSSSPAQQ